MSSHSNDPNFGQAIIDMSVSNESENDFRNDESVKTSVLNYEHPFFTANGAVKMINFCRNYTNSEEKLLSGDIKYQVFQDVAKAALQTKVPYDILLFCVDWDNDLTKRSGASDAVGIAQKLIGFSSQIRSSMGRDPLMGEMLLAHVFGNAGEVKKRYDLNEKKPEEEAQVSGTKKDDVILYKKRGDKKKKRTNREVYDFFYKRINIGKNLFKMNLGKM